MIASCRGCDVGDRVATLSYINRSFKNQRSRVANGNVTNAEDATGCAVRTLRHGAVIAGCRQSCRQQVIQEDTCGVRISVVGDFDLEGNSITFVWRVIATKQRLDSDKIGFLNSYCNCLFQVITSSGRIGLIACCCSCYVGNRVSTLTRINRSLDGQRDCLANIKRSDGEFSSGGVIR